MINISPVSNDKNILEGYPYNVQGPVLAYKLQKQTTEVYYVKNITTFFLTTHVFIHNGIKQPFTDDFTR